MERVNLQHGRRVERFGVDPDPVPVATEDLEPSAGVRMPPYHDSSFDVETVLSGSALVGVLFFISALVLGSLDAGLMAATR